MMWTTLLILVAFAAGYWLGHYVGWTDHEVEVRDGVLGRAWKRLPPEKQEELSQNVVWAFRHILQREPTPEDIGQWEKLNCPLRHLVDEFMKTKEFRGLTHEKRFEARAAVERHFAGSAR